MCQWLRHKLNNLYEKIVHEIQLVLFTHWLNCTQSLSLLPDYENNVVSSGFHVLNEQCDLWTQSVQLQSILIYWSLSYWCVAYLFHLCLCWVSHAHPTYSIFHIPAVILSLEFWISFLAEQHQQLDILKPYSSCSINNIHILKDPQFFPTSVLTAIQLNGLSFHTISFVRWCLSMWLTWNNAGVFWHWLLWPIWNALSVWLKWLLTCSIFLHACLPYLGNWDDPSGIVWVSRETGREVNALSKISITVFIVW